MTTSALLAQLLQGVKLAFRFPPVASPSRQRYKRELNYQEIQKKDILTLDEAAFYIGTDPEILLEEVSCGHIPGGQLAGQWLFYKWALAQQFAGYRQPGNDEPDDIFENFQEEIDKACDFKAVSRLLDEYASGERNFSGIDLSWASLKGVSLPGIDFVEAILTGIDLQKSSLQEGQFMDTIFEGANLSGADFTNANLEGANLAHADLSQTTLIAANLRGVNLKGTNLSGALLQDAIF
ncbi:pentapeptide repeat-containing protein [Chlorogloea sp. CCALA 695]|uniref:pentapeptide repeat-containing protein n=1 Tax=Chlorogloea sp. CCALA 695 TaxID=2107693 RepID=UPI000D073FE2|nr:pentapeptide repeat-containing protein [Chlorogloea sp. CCALA 695]PSB25847.1 hypothetical protein C7B70_24550 [Chlorogloea sp. CCALA 695]